ncbi:MAG: N-acetyltransferase [Bacteroidota bacterium]
MMLRKAKMSDVESIHRLINDYAAQGLMLGRSRNMLYENLREFTVVEEEGRFLGTGALHIIWEDLAEIRALALEPDVIKHGIGRRLVETLIEEARALEIRTVFALTYQPGFFEKCGFRVVHKDDMPQKVWKECINCPKFPHCDEIAMTYQVT